MATRGRNPYWWVAFLLVGLLIFLFNFSDRLGDYESRPIWLPVVFGSFLLICGIAAYLIWRKESEVERMREAQIEQWQADMLDRKLGTTPENPPSEREDSSGHSEKSPSRQ